MLDSESPESPEPEPDPVLSSFSEKERAKLDKIRKACFDFFKSAKIKPRKYRIGVLDLESKDGESQRAGFDRVFLSTFEGSLRHAEGLSLIQHRNDKSTNKLPYLERACSSGGCIAKTLEEIFASDNFVVQPRRARRGKSGQETPSLPGMRIYAHNGGNFDFVHMLPFFSRPENTVKYQLSLVSNGGRIIVLKVRERARRKRLDGAVVYSAEVVLAAEQAVAEARTKAARKAALEHLAAMMKAAPASREWAFYDTGIPDSLDNLAEIVGEAKEELDLQTPEDDPRWEPYNTQDCASLRKVMEALQEEIYKLGGELKATLPASAIHLLRTAFLTSPIRRNAHLPGCPATCRICRRLFCPKNCKGRKKQLRKALTWRVHPKTGILECNCPTSPFACAHQEIRKSVYGGRTEVFSHYAEDIHYLDFSSSYPFAMRGPMPVGRMHVRDGADGLESYIRSRMEIAAEDPMTAVVEATVYIPPDTYIPPLPLRIATKNGYEKVCFPAGYLGGIWDLEELLLVLGVLNMNRKAGAPPTERAHIRTIGKIYTFDAERSFADFIDALYKIKSDPKSPPALKTISKLLLNSSFGKFIMHVIRESVFMLRERELPPDGADFVSDVYEALGVRAAVGYQVVDQDYQIPAIGGRITADARIRLWRCDYEAHNAGATLLMNDTDSLLTTFDNFPPLVDPVTGSDLGSFKDEYPDHPHLKVWCYSNKSYVIKSDRPFMGKHKPECPTAKCRKCRGKDKAMKAACPCCKGCSTEQIRCKGLDRRSLEKFMKSTRAESYLSAMSGIAKGAKVVMERQPKFKAVARAGYKPLATKRQEWTTLLDYDKREWLDSQGNVDVHADDGDEESETGCERVDWRGGTENRDTKPRFISYDEALMIPWYVEPPKTPSKKRHIDLKSLRKASPLGRVSTRAIEEGNVRTDGQRRLFGLQRSEELLDKILSHRPYFPFTRSPLEWKDSKKRALHSREPRLEHA